jgi:hypothetical protein
MNHYMVDLETMGLRENSAIVSIGVVEFDETTLGRNFYTNVSLESCIEAGLVTDQSTIDWWSKQTEGAQNAWKQSPESLMASLRLLCRFFEGATGGASAVRLWGNGAGFDNVLLKNAFKALDADEPWKYFNNRCYRTMAAVFPLTDEEMPARVGTYHNALDDALTQTLRLQAICKKYGIKLL